MDWSDIINLFIALFSAYSAYKSHRISESAFNFEKRITNESLKPKMFLKEESIYYINHKIVNYDAESKIDLYEPFDLKLLNTGRTKLLSLKINLRFKETPLYKKLIKNSIDEENSNIVREGADYSWDGIFPLSEVTNSYLEVLDENTSVNIKIPSIFVALMIGNNISIEQNKTKNKINKLKLRITISFQTIYSSKTESIEREINFTFDNTTEVLQGPTVISDSLSITDLDIY